ncbi:YlmC/YmxH family sporulation protein [Clostridiales bacterium PH28_bin88]|nr:YlmC/YmxH family sporulation protein [Clostridiales bacterium PH28_bin88]
MKLSELIGKEIVNIYDGARLGTVGDSDLVIDAGSGEVDAIILPGRGMMSLRSDRNQMVIPWQSVRKIGSEVIIVELDQARARIRRY